MFRKLVAKVRRLWEGRRTKNHVCVRGTESGIALFVNNQTIWRIAWTDIKEIFGYKDDVVTYDIICIGFRISDEGLWCRMDEQMSGYHEVVSELERRFTLKEGWWQHVAYPAFERNFTHLWGEPFDWDKLEHGRG